MNIFGFSGRRASDDVKNASEADLAAASAPVITRANLGSDGRADLLTQICDFLLNSTLAITPRNMVVHLRCLFRLKGKQGLQAWPVA